MDGIWKTHALFGLATGFFICLGFGISFIWSAIDYNCWYCWIVGIGLINMASFLVLVMVYVIKHDRNRLGYI